MVNAAMAAVKTFQIAVCRLGKEEARKKKLGN